MAGRTDEAGPVLALEQIDDDGIVALLVDGPGLVGHSGVGTAVRFDGAGRRFALDAIQILHKPSKSKPWFVLFAHPSSRAERIRFDYDDRVSGGSRNRESKFQPGTVDLEKKTNTHFICQRGHAKTKEFRPSFFAR